MDSFILSKIATHCGEKEYRRVCKLWCRVIDLLPTNPDNPSVMSPTHFEKIADRINWIKLSWYYRLSEEFIELWADRVDWHQISIWQRLSEKFIAKWADRLEWRWILRYQKLSEKFITRNEQIKFNWKPVLS